MAAVAQQKAGELLAARAQGMYRIETGAHQIAHRLVPGVRDLYRRQLAGPTQSCQAGRIASVGLDPVAGPLRDQRGRDHTQWCRAPTADVGCCNL